MKCLIAAEPEPASAILDNLKKVYPDYDFEVCFNTKNLANYIAKRPDVLLLSMYLPDDDPMELLKTIPVMFPASYIVLMTGVVNEKARTYIRIAKNIGFENIITGKLPGDQPYTLFTALNDARKEIIENDFKADDEDIKKPQPAVEDSIDNTQIAVDEDLEKVQSVVTEKIEKNQSVNDEDIEKAEPAVDEDIEITEPVNNEEVEKTKTIVSEDIENVQSVVNEDIIKTEPVKETPELKRNDYHETARRREPHKTMITTASRLRQQLKRGSGKVIVATSNKGGVGKTTVSITLAKRLASCGKQVVLVDLNLAAPDIATFFNLKDRPGMEILQNKKNISHYLDDLIVEVEDGLHVLPGPSNKIMPDIPPAQVAEMIELLADMYPIVVLDTPPEFWVKDWLEAVFPRADLILAVVDQSKFSELETRDYAPKLLLMGASPEKIKIVCNRFSPKLHKIQVIEKHFNQGFKKQHALPKVIAVIPEDWEKSVKREYTGQTGEGEKGFDPWEQPTKEIIKLLGLNMNTQVIGNERKKPGSRGLFGEGGLFGILRKN